MRFAQFASAAGLGGAIASMVAAPVLGFYLDSCGHIYRYTFFMSSGLAVAGVLLLLATHAGFMSLGGPHAYEAPAGYRRE
jgi:hypothetical protein